MAADLESTLDGLCNSPFWDSNLTWKSQTPDFTECFHHTALVWAPCLFLWLLAPLEVYYLHTATVRNIPWTTPNYMKLISAILLVMLSTMQLVYDKVISITIWPVLYFYTSLFRCVTLVLALMFILMERDKGMNTTGVLYLFWLIQFLCNLITYRSLVLSRLALPAFSHSIFMLCFPLVIIQLVYSSLTNKTSVDNKNKLATPCPENYASFFSRMVFSWVNSLIIKGYKRPLLFEDLWALDKNNMATHISSRFDFHWQKERDWKGNDASVARSIIRAFGAEFFIAAFLKLVSDLLVFASPIVLRMMIRFVTSDEPTWHGYYYAAVMFAASMVQSLFLSQHNHRSQYFGTRVKTALMLMVYRKALRITTAVKKKMPLGEIVNLMAVDSQTIVDMLTELAFYWSAPFLLFGATFMLWQMLGVAVVSGLVVMVIVIPINTAIASVIKGLQQNMMKCRDRRLKTMNELMTGIKLLKLYAWEKSFYQLVQNIRDEELKEIIKLSFVKSLVLFLFQITPVTVSLATLGSYVMKTSTHTLDPTKVFVSLSLLHLLRAPLNSLPTLITMFMQSLVSFRRIQDFMNADEINLKGVDHQNLGDLVIVIDDGTFSWGSDSCCAISDVGLQIKAGQLVLVVGPVGSGKSSLLVSILGETRKVSGWVNTTGTISYVSQQAWIKNATLRKNIIFGKQLNVEFYDEVINACALAPDLELLPGRDFTEIGEKGVNLSGGQKQRVSLARAVYSDAEIFLLDDPLSAVDSHVGKHLIDHVIGPHGMLRKKTRILATHNLACLPYADQIVVLNQGRITEIGTFKELLKNRGAFSEFLKMYLKTKVVLDEVESQNFQEDKVVLEVIKDTELKRELLTKLSRTYEAQGRKCSKPPSFFQTGPGTELSSWEDKAKTRDERETTTYYSSAETRRANTNAGGTLSKQSSPTQSASHLITSVNADDVNLSESGTSLRFRGGVSSITDNRVSPFPEISQAPGPSNSSPTFHRHYSPYSNKLLSSAELELRSKLITDEAAEVGEVSWSVYRYYLSSLGYGIAALVILFSFLSEICNVGANMWLSQWSSDPPTLDGSQDIALRNYRLKIYAILGLGQTIFMWFGAMLITYGTLCASRILHDQMLFSILRAPMEFFDQTPQGRLMNRFAKDMETADETVPRPIRPLITHVLHVVATVYIITCNTPAFFLVVPPLSMLYYIIQKVYLSTSRQLKRLEAISRSPIFAQFSETVTGLATIRAYKKEADFIKETEEAIDINQILTYPRIAVKRWLALRLDFIGQIVVFSTGAFAAYNRHSIPPGIVGLIISYAVQVTHLLSVLVRMAGDLENSIVSVERIKEYTQIAKEAEWDIPETQPPKNWPQNGKIEFENYSLRYRKNLDPALNDITLTIFGGEKIGLIGRTGAGKSSLTVALFRIVESNEGRIIIDDVEISKIGLHDLRSRLSIIPQEPILFSGTLRLNLDPLNNHTDDEITRVLRQSNLSEFVTLWNEGMDFAITESGDNLSIGQRQLVCLARALLRKSKILILDEATAAVDLETDDHIHQTIRNEFTDCTVITIAHRLHTIMDNNRVLVLEGGKVAEFDTPQNLLQKESIFRNMVDDAGLLDTTTPN